MGLHWSLGSLWGPWETFNQPSASREDAKEIKLNLPHQLDYEQTKSFMLITEHL